jgi:hypothetical protein
MDTGYGATAQSWARRKGWDWRCRRWRQGERRRGSVQSMAAWHLGAAVWMVMGVAADGVNGGDGLSWNPWVPDWVLKEASLSSDEVAT